jgi:hypothetical protein
MSALLLPHSFGHAHLLWHRDFDAQVAQLPAQARVRELPARTLKDGTVMPARTEQYYVQPKPVPSTAKNLMTHLITLGIKAVEQQNKRAGMAPGFDFDQVGTDANELATPSISVNCKQLGEYCNLSTRTIRTQLNLLLKMGALLRKQGHGTRANFELWVNPKYVCKTDENAVENFVNTAGEYTKEPVRISSQLTKFPLSVSFETLETQKVQISHVDKLVTDASFEGEVPELATLAGNTGPLAKGEPGSLTPEIGAQGPRAGRPRKVTSPTKTARTAPGTLSRQRKMEFVMSLWAYARPLLYAGVAFDEEQHKKAQNAIWKGVFAGFPDGKLTEREWEMYHRQTLERVDLVADWMKRNARTLPAPYAEVVAGRGYFDAQNALGFIGTEAWLENKMINQHQYRLTQALRLAEKEIRGHRRRTASKRVLALTASQLFHKHFAKISAFRDERALRQLAAIASGSKS